MIPLEKPGSGDSSPAAASGSGRASRGPSTPRRPPPPARGLLTEIRTAVRTEPFQDSYSLSPGRELGRATPSAYGSFRLRVESELQLPAHTTATATLDSPPTEQSQGSNLHPHGC